MCSSDLVAGHAAGRNGSGGLVDGIDMAIEPIVGGLAGAAHQRPRYREAGQYARPLVGEGDAARNRAAPESPHRRKPGDGFQELEDGLGSGTLHVPNVKMTAKTVN